MLFVSFVSTTMGYSQGSTIQGKIIDQSSGDAISYVNIGIVHRQTGTVSDSAGFFNLIIPDSLIDENLTISAIGYEAKHIYLQEFINNREAEISLIPKVYKLDRVTVSASKLKEQTVGIKWNGLLKVAGMIEDDNLGFEFALGMNCKRYPCIIKKVDLDILKNEHKPALFRLNIYEAELNKPATNILRSPILVETDLTNRTLVIPLEEDSVQVNKDFFVSIEWIQDPTANTNRKLYLRGRLMGNKRTWVRKTSQDSWRKVNKLNLVMSADVLN